MEFDVSSLYGRRADQRWNRMAVGDILERLTWSHPDKDAIVARPGAHAAPEFERVTYRQADEAANQVANALLAAGLERGDRVLLYCDNSVEAVLCLFGIAKAGLVAVPVNHMMAPDVVEWIIGHVKPRFAIVDDTLWNKVEDAFAKADMRASVTIPIGGELVPGSESFGEWISGQPSTEPVLEINLHADDIWVLLFTSGTTSMPKAAMLSHAFTYTAAQAFTLSLTRSLRMESDLRLCSFLPLIFHTSHHAGLFPAFFAGGTVILGRGADAEATVSAVVEERATALWGGSPAFLDQIADAALTQPARDLSTLTVALFSWGAMHPDIAAKLKGLCGEDLVLIEAFGQTESISCCRFWLHAWPEKVQSSGGAVNYVGVPNPTLAVTVFDTDGMSLQSSPGIPGEAVSRSPAVLAGYYLDEPATRAVFEHGWFHSGDSCQYDEDGLLIMVDRYKDIVKSGGENVSSQRVESVVAQHPGILQAAVIGLPDERWGERVTAVVVAQPGRELVEDDVIAFSRERLGGFETPKQVIFVDEMPHTVGGKILKYKLRERFAQSSSALAPPGRRA